MGDYMKAMITGATSGIGLDMAKYLAKKKYELILVSKDKEKLELIQEKLSTKVTIIVADLSVEQKVKELYVLTRKENIDILINNAGFGVHGNLSETDLNKELDMINTNIKAVHILTKSFLKEMERKNFGYILNVSSLAAFQPGPLMASYYATKSYVYNLTAALYYEQKKKKSNVHLSILAPGPVDTEFNKKLNIKKRVKPISSSYVAKYAIEKMLDHKLLIIPGFKYKVSRVISKIIPHKLLLKITYRINKKI